MRNYRHNLGTFFYYYCFLAFFGLQALFIFLSVYSVVYSI